MISDADLLKLLDPKVAGPVVNEISMELILLRQFLKTILTILETLKNTDP